MTVPQEVKLARHAGDLDDDGHDTTGGSSDLDAIITASSGQDIADALSGAAAPDAGNVFATMADVGGGGGALVLLEQHTASSSATLDFTSFISSTYDEYVVELVNVIPASNNPSLLLRMSTDGGSTYDTSAIYDYTSGYAYSGGVGVGASATNSTAVVLMDAISNSANYGVTGSFRLYSPSSTALYKLVHGQTMRFDQGGAIGLVLLNILGSYKSTTAVDAVRFLMSTGNVASGTIRIYGLVK